VLHERLARALIALTALGFVLAIWTAFLG